jgi:hypothetical protein
VLLLYSLLFFFFLFLSSHRQVYFQVPAMDRMYTKLEAMPESTPISPSLLDDHNPHHHQHVAGGVHPNASVSAENGSSGGGMVEHSVHAHHSGEYTTGSLASSYPQVHFILLLMICLCLLFYVWSFMFCHSVCSVLLLILCFGQFTFFSFSRCTSGLAFLDFVDTCTWIIVMCCNIGGD